MCLIAIFSISWLNRERRAIARGNKKGWVSLCFFFLLVEIFRASLFVYTYNSYRCFVRLLPAFCWIKYRAGQRVKCLDLHFVCNNEVGMISFFVFKLWRVVIACCNWKDCVNARKNKNFLCNSQNLSAYYCMYTFT